MIPTTATSDRAPRSGTTAATLGFGLLLSFAYFLAPVFLLAALSLGLIFWTAIGFLDGCALLLDAVIAIPVWLAARAIFEKWGRVGLGFLTFAVAGVVTSIIGFGILGSFQSGAFDPIDGLGFGNGGAVIALSVWAGICSALGWLTVQLHATPAPYEDALGGHTFEELARLVDSDAAHQRAAEDRLS